MSAEANKPFRMAKIPELESVRGLAAFLIVFYHLPAWNPFMDITLKSHAVLMVELFFVLSGFVICTAYKARVQDVQDLFRFQFLRFGRLYPVHVLFLGVYLLIELLKYYAQVRLGFSSAHNQPFKENNLTAFVQQLLLLQAIGPTGNSLTFNWPAWSISVEFYTYLIFGVVICFFKQVKAYLFSGFVVVSLAMLSTQITFGFDDLARCLAGFFLGCLTAIFVEKKKLMLPGYVPLFFFIAVVAFVIHVPPRPFHLLFFFLSAALIGSLVMSQGGVLKSVLQARPLTALGAISYSMYMSHTAIIWGLNQMIRLGLRRSEVNGAPQLSMCEAVIALMLTVLLTIFVASLVYRWVEKPWREKSRRFVFGGMGDAPSNQH
ncbi:acyltransferase family protein [Prosthecobacter fluviatilis]|uniref:Acyltransferase family protein n=1 Tax=Prosthecobacter fluviatilis TaxID=445931 RepID=A0ABW0KSG3_9BACT